MKRSQWCWGVTGERGLVVRALDQRSCWPVCPGPEKSSYRGHLHLPSQKKQVVYESGTCDMSHLIPCNFLSFEIFDWIQFQRDHCRPLVHESPLGVRRQPVVRLDSINYHLWGQKCSSSVNFPPFSSFVIKGQSSEGPLKCNLGFLGGSDGEESACNAGGWGVIPESGRSPGEGNGNPLQYSCLENSFLWHNV